MRRKKTIIKIGLIALAAAVLPIMRAGVAGADYAATGYDYVGIAGDTPQFSADFLANGDPDGDPGFNALGPKDRLVTFDSESDANGRAAYYGTDSGAESGLAQDPTEVLRDGENPTQRTSSSGNAITALGDDTSGDINFIFSSTALSTTTTYPVTLHEYEFGTDTVELAAASATVAPASGLTDADLLGIYDTGNITNWDQITDVPGYTGPDATIYPLIPPTSSAITKTFEEAIDSGNTFTVAGDVTQVEQNDPTAITLNANADDAIVPFSEARYNLLEGTTATGGTLGTSGPYFPAIPGEPGFVTGDAGESYPAQPQYSPSIKLLASSATKTVTDYVDIRQSDLSDTTKAEPGSAINWAQYLFAGADGWSTSNPTTGVTPYIASGAAQTLIKESGVTPDYVDEGPFT